MRSKTAPIITLILYISINTVTGNKCPPIQKPCLCTSSKHEPIAIRCDRAASIEAIIKSLPKRLFYLDSLTISNTPIPELPPYIFKDFTIKRLSLRNNGMFDIHPEAFDGNLDSLEELELRANRLGTIPQSAIPKLLNLRTLIISEDNISKITDYTFNTWRSKGRLQKLELSSNYLSSISKQGFTGLKALKQLSLDKNLFQRIPTDALRSLVNLEELSMSVNDIQQVPAGSLPLPNLKSLSFEVNQISTLSADAFQETPQILYLYLSGNQFTAIDGNMFYYINQLKVLAIGNNAAITKLSTNAFQYIPSLIRLEMPDCSISYIEPKTLQKLPKLQVLVLRNNRLTRIEKSTFSSLNEVVSIDVRQNKINSIDNFAFSNLNKLRHLDISGNQLEYLPENTFYGTYIATNPPITRIIYLYDNPWKCDQKLQWMREWLRTNNDILLTAPGQKPASCQSPRHLTGLDLRQNDPYSIATVKTSGIQLLPDNAQLNSVNSNAADNSGTSIPNSVSNAQRQYYRLPDAKAGAAVVFQPNHTEQQLNNNYILQIAQTSDVVADHYNDTGVNATTAQLQKQQHYYGGLPPSTTIYPIKLSKLSPPSSPQSHITQLSTAKDTRVSQASVIILILGIILGLCTLGVILVVLTKCIGKWRNRKRGKQTFQDIVTQGSSFSGIGSRYSSGIYPQNYFQRSSYPVESQPHHPLQQQQQQHSTQRLPPPESMQQFSNRNWNWWF